MKTFFVHDINPVPWKVTTNVKDGNLTNYQNALREYLEANYTEEQRSWPEGKLELSFLFARDTTRGRPADVSNLTKATEDAIQDVITGNDRNNAKVSAEMYDQGPGVTPAIIIWVEPYHQWEDMSDVMSIFDEHRPKPRPLIESEDLQSFF